MFEFQTAISRADRAAGLERLGLRGPVGGRGRRLPGEAREQARRSSSISRGVHPHSRETLDTHVGRLRHDGRRDALDEQGATDVEALAAAVDDDTAAVFVQQPNFLGTVEDLGGRWPRPPSARGALLVWPADPLTLGILEAARRVRRRHRVGEGQSLGNRLDFGGPSFGFFAAHERYIRKMPGRIAGETVDVDGKRGFVLTLQTREQHIRREKATSNICTAQALNALAGVIYLSLARQAGARRARRADAAAHALRARDARASRRSTRARSCASSPCACRTSTRSSSARARRASIRGYRLGRDYPEYEDGLLVAITERRTQGARSTAGRRRWAEVGR